MQDQKKILTFEELQSGEYIVRVDCRKPDGTTWRGRFLGYSTDNKAIVETPRNRYYVHRWNLIRFHCPEGTTVVI